MNKTITVLTSVYNGSLYLREAIESTLSQTHHDFEFLIVDDASTDDSLACIESYKDCRIRIVRNEKNIGQVASLNLGLRLARGEYIARLDQDDVNLPKRLEEQLYFMRANPHLAIVCSFEHTIDSEGQYVRSWRGEIPNYGHFLGTIMLGLCPVWHPSVMFRRDVVIELDGYDDTFPISEDYELWSRIALKRLNGAIVPRFHLHQRIHSQRQSVLKADVQRNSLVRAQERVIAEFWREDGAQGLAALLRLEPNQRIQLFDRSYIRQSSKQIHELLLVIRSNKYLTHIEYKSLSRRVYNRIGWGIRIGDWLTRLPNGLFQPTFVLLSPRLIKQINSILSRLYSRLCIVLSGIVHQVLG